MLRSTVASSMAKAQQVAAASYLPTRDPSRLFSANGRPMKKPQRVAMRLGSLSSVPRSELSDYLILERPSAASWKYMSLKSCRESRPPMRSDLDGPTPCTYSALLPTKAIHGTKISPKSKYARNALPYPTTDLWTFNVAVSGKNPTPCSYSAPNVLGRCCPIKREAPSYTMGCRTIKPMLNKPGADKDPSPNAYNSAQSLEYVFQQSPAFSIQVKREPNHRGSSPGPAHYHPDHAPTLHKSPAFTMGYRRQRQQTASNDSTLSII